MYIDNIIYLLAIIMLLTTTLITYSFLKTRKVKEESEEKEGEAKGSPIEVTNFMPTQKSIKLDVEYTDGVAVKSVVIDIPLALLNEKNYDLSYLLKYVTQVKVEEKIEANSKGLDLSQDDSEEDEEGQETEEEEETEKPTERPYDFDE